MNILMLTLLYPDDMMEEAEKNTKDKIQYQINNYQRGFIDGIRQNGYDRQNFAMINALPVGIFPFQYRKLLIPSGMHDDNTIQELGCINLPYFKQIGRKRRALRAVEKWLQKNKENRTILVYTMYLPYLEALVKIKQKYADLHVCVIVTDLPNEMGLASGRKGMLKRIEYQRGARSMRLCRQMDSFILLTKPMAKALQVESKPYLVIEGLILTDQCGAGHDTALENKDKPAVLYTGTLEPSLGIRAMLEAFFDMPEYELWICGQGSMAQEVQSAAAMHPNIRYFGFVAQKEALRLQAQADALINPRTPENVFTRYSFPSKTLEYMRTGKPVICCKLEGIPDEYDPYLLYIGGNGSEAIQEAVQSLFRLSKEEQKAMGQRAHAYVADNKNPQCQCRKLLDFLSQISH